MEIFGIVLLLVAFIVLISIAWIANMAEARRQREESYRWLAMSAYSYLGILYLALLLAGLGLQVAMAMEPSFVTQLPPEFVVDSWPVLTMGVWVPSLLGILLLVPGVRRLVARFVPIDPQSPVHAIALSLSMMVLINLFFTLGIGLGNLADQAEAGGEVSESITLLSLWIQQILTAFLAMIGVGWLSRRTLSETLVRLGLVRPTIRQVLIGIGTALIMIMVVFLINMVASVVGVSADEDVDRLTEQLLGSLFTTPFGILTIGLSAGLGEETLFRGALLPRFGIILSTVFFALLHSNYGITLSTVVVLILGTVLALLRTRYNTTTAMITHAVYNSTLGLIAYFAVSWLDF